MLWHNNKGGGGGEGGGVWRKNSLQNMHEQTKE